MALNSVIISAHLTYSTALRLSVFLITALFLFGNAHAILLGDSSKGEALHNSKCLACHGAQFKDPAQIYTRTNRRVKSVEGLMKQVMFCNKQTGAGLNDGEINDVIKYLNDKYYKFE